MTNDSSKIINSMLICICLSLIALTTATGNIIVILAFYYDKKLRTVNDFFIMNMAIADFLVGFFCIPFYIPYSIKQSWPFGRLFCKIWVTVDDVSTMASVINIVVISINRYWSIAYPISYRKYVRQNFVYLVMAVVWCLSVSKNEENRKDCSGDYNRSFIYMLIAQFNYFIWPFIVLCILNLLIMLNIWKRTRKMNNTKINNPYKKKTNCSDKFNNSINDPYHVNNCQTLTNKRRSSSNSPEITTNKRNFIQEYSPITQKKCPINKKLQRKNNNSTKIVYSSHSRILSIKSSNIKSKTIRINLSDSIIAACDTENEIQLTETIKNQTKEICRTDRLDLRIKRDRKAARSLFILVIVFLIFLFPYVICAIITTAGFKISETIFEISFWLLWMNSTCNPFLYPFIQIKYRRAYVKLFQSCFKHIHFKSSNYFF
ncbi:unnamed protein product [Rotaria magnacalcarata]|uniref:G-protein coupled receptors family 1 profile domain-containing protein n=1 Tax=Rotaria magnacalcarata TaxID=392030 RepID=A0A819K156_9BILA|nr:unnamed protein product [Rotaria magnacalcarata]